MTSFRGALSLGELEGIQERFLAVSLSVLHLGTGLSYSSLAIYLNRHVGLSPSVYGVGMGVAAALGIVSGPLAGRLADRRNGHRAYAGLVWAMCVATLAFIVSPAWLTLVLLSVLTVCGRGGAAVIGALIGRAVDPEYRVRYRAVVKSLSSVAMVVGLGLGALVLAWGSVTAFRVSFVVEAVTFLVAGSLVWVVGTRITPANPVSPQARTDWGKPDRGATGLPVRAADRAQRRAVAFGIDAHCRSAVVGGDADACSTVAGVDGLGRADGGHSAATDPGEPPGHRRGDRGRRGAALLAVAAVLFPVAALADHGAVAIAVVVALALALVGGEVLFAAASWAMVYGLAPESSLGRYQGLYNTGFDLSMIVGPVLFAWFAGTGTRLGWLGLGVVFLLAGLALVPLTTRRAAPAPAVTG